MTEEGIDEEGGAIDGADGNAGEKYQRDED
jgi:hypothetical protein